MIRADGLTSDQLRAEIEGLPDSAVVEAGGHRYVLGDLRAKRLQRREQVMSRREQRAQEAADRKAAKLAQFATEKTQRQRQDMANFEARVARAKQEWAQVAVFEGRARDVLARAKNATSAAERAQLAQEADAIVKEYERFNATRTFRTGAPNEPGDSRR